MKEKLELYNDSLEKWETVLKNIRHKECINYMKLYNHKCGFCKVYENITCLSNCPLNVYDPESEMRYCGEMYHECLKHADKREWNHAEALCIIFVNKIKEVIANE